MERKPHNSKLLQEQALNRKLPPRLKVEKMRLKKRDLRSCKNINRLELKNKLTSFNRAVGATDLLGSCWLDIEDATMLFLFNIFQSTLAAA